MTSWQNKGALTTKTHQKLNINTSLSFSFFPFSLAFLLAKNHLLLANPTTERPCCVTTAAPFGFSLSVSQKSDTFKDPIFTCGWRVKRRRQVQRSERTTTTTQISANSCSFSASGSCLIRDDLEIQGRVVPHSCCCCYMGHLCRSHPGQLIQLFFFLLNLFYVFWFAHYGWNFSHGHAFVCLRFVFDRS